MSKHEVIYITGPPASGKTTLIKKLGKTFPSTRIFIYSELLSHYLSNRDKIKFSQRKLRQLSATKVGAEDILAVDKLLIRNVSNARRSGHVLIDSHPVTKEAFGFRVTPFSIEFLKLLKPSKICMLYTDAATVIKRIENHPKGRPQISLFEADFHCFAQVSLSITYGIHSKAPIFFYDSSKGISGAFAQIGRYLSDSK